MKFLILCDQKPNDCKSCPFCGDVPVVLASNLIDIQTKCILGDFTAQTCPMTEAHTLFDTSLPAKKSTPPVAFCEHCQHYHTYNIRYKKDSFTVRGNIFKYDKAEAYCNVCKQSVKVEDIENINLCARDEAYFAAGDSNAGV